MGNNCNPEPMTIQEFNRIPSPKIHILVDAEHFNLIRDIVDAYYTTNEDVLDADMSYKLKELLDYLWAY